MTEKFWPFTKPLHPLLDNVGAPLDQLAAFQPDAGPPIVRRRHTARIESWRLAVIFRDFATFSAFETWFDAELMQGALPFLWLHPVRPDLCRFRFDPATYNASFLGAERVRVSFSALILPGSPTDLPPSPTKWMLEAAAQSGLILYCDWPIP